MGPAIFLVNDVTWTMRSVNYWNKTKNFQLNTKKDWEWQLLKQNKTWINTPLSFHGPCAAAAAEVSSHLDCWANREDGGETIHNQPISCGFSQCLTAHLYTTPLEKIKRNWHGVQDGVALPREISWKVFGRVKATWGENLLHWLIWQPWEQLQSEI